VKYPTERDVRIVVECQLGALDTGTLGGRVAATLGTIIDRYVVEEFPALQHSTQTTNKSLIDLHIRPKWQDVRLADVTAIAVKQRMEKLPFGAASKVRARNMVSKLLDLAMLWEYIPVNRNPMELIRVKGSTKRQKQITVISPAQFKALVGALPEPYNLMVLISGYLGLRVSETLGLKWKNFNFDECILSIGQVFTHRKVQNVPKTDASGNEIPVPLKLCEILKEWHGRQQHEHSCVFAGHKTGSPYSDATILDNHLKPAALGLGIQGLGWHTLRHSYKSWMAATKISPAQMKDLMRHSDIETTMNVYGRTLTPELRAANTAVAEQLL
jgi:integrase